MGPVTAEVDLLERADGSGRYSFNGYEVLAAVNGPVEVQRRDELPDEAAIDVTIRPAAGVAAIRERHFESLVHGVLRQVIRTRSHPRTLIQVTLQVTSSPETSFATGKLPQSASNLPLLPILLNAALLALLTTTIPLETTYIAGIFVVDASGNAVAKTTPKELGESQSVHVVCLDRKGDTLLSESEGRFQLEEWLNILDHASDSLLEDTGDVAESMDVDSDAGASDLQANVGLVRQAVLRRLRRYEAWRQTG